MRTTLLTAALAPTAALAVIQPRNFIFIIPDGFGPAAETLERTYEALANGASTPQAPVIEGLPLDALEVGHTRTHSANNLVTDSAAAGTALAAGAKTGNGLLGLDPAGAPVGTVLEAAKLAGLRTGLVVTSIINHATPAAFSAHARSRNSYAAIAAQQVGLAHPLNQSVDVLLGGGACYFKPAGAAGSCRDDAVDLLAHAADVVGYTVAQDRAGFDALPASLPLLGLFNNDGHLAYEVDRLRQPAAAREPSLAEMTDLALRALTSPAAPAPAPAAGPASRVRRQPGRRAANATAPGGEDDGETPGFFLMIEASRIDHAAHANDAATLLGEVQAYHETVGVVRAWIDEHPDTAVVSVADHETGGLTLPAGHDPRALAGARQSAEHLAAAWAASDTRPRDAAALRAEVLAPYGVADATAAEVAALLAATGTGDFAGLLAAALSRRAGIAWSTGGHSAVDVALYAYAAGAMGEQLRQDLAGGSDNTRIPKYIAESLGLDLDEVTRRLRAVGGDWIP